VSGEQESSEEIRTFAVGGLPRRVDVIGVPLGAR
jgi:hypothetical protein